MRFTGQPFVAARETQTPSSRRSAVLKMSAKSGGTDLGPPSALPVVGSRGGAKVSHLSSSSLWPTVCVSSLGELRGGRRAVAHLSPLPLFSTPSLGVDRQGRGRGCARKALLSAHFASAELLRPATESYAKKQTKGAFSGSRIGTPVTLSAVSCEDERLANLPSGSLVQRGVLQQDEHPRGREGLFLRTRSSPGTRGAQC